MKQIPNVRDLRNILVLRGEGSLGDAIISSCCYRNIKKVSPQTKITVACFGSAYDFIAHNPYIDEVARLPVRHIIRPNQRWISLFLTALKLRKCQFDLVLDSSNKDFWNWRAFKWIVGGDRVLDCFTSPVRPFGAPDKHGSKHEQAILKLLGIEDADKSYDLPISAHTRQDVQNWLESRKLSSYILINPSGSIDKRGFRPDMLHEICMRLRVLGLPFVVATLPRAYDKWVTALKDMPDVQIKRTADVFELFDLVRRAVLVVTPDTAAVHIASGFEKPSLVFYNTLSAYNAPENPKALIIQSSPEDINRFDWKDFLARLDALKQLL